MNAKQLLQHRGGVGVAHGSDLVSGYQVSWSCLGGGRLGLEWLVVRASGSTQERRGHLYLQSIEPQRTCIPIKLKEESLQFWTSLFLSNRSYFLNKLYFYFPYIFYPNFAKPPPGLLFWSLSGKGGQRSGGSRLSAPPWVPPWLCRWPPPGVCLSRLGGATFRPMTFDFWTGIKIK